MTIGSLFSGVGGLELGLEWAGLGPTIWQVEKDPKLRNCLATHWPKAERFEDVLTVGKAQLQKVDLICGGPPCQDISSAGKGAGLSGARSGLWFEMERIISELKPIWVVVENVASGAPKWVDKIRTDLERQGYQSLPIPIAASDCGAWHRRARVFVVAYCTGEKSKEITPGRTRREMSSRNASHSSSGGSKATSHTNNEGQLQSVRCKPEIGQWACDSSIWSIEPNVARMVHGFPERTHRERALGNSVVPQCAQVIGEVINYLNGTHAS